MCHTLEKSQQHDLLTQRVRNWHFEKYIRFIMILFFISRSTAQNSLQIKAIELHLLIVLLEEENYS